MSMNAVAIRVNSFAGYLADLFPEYVEECDCNCAEQHTHDRRLEGVREVLLNYHSTAF